MTSRRRTPLSSTPREAACCYYHAVAVFFLGAISVAAFFLPVTQGQLVSSRISDRESVIPHHGRCEPITIALCKDIRYNETIMPNLLNHQKQEDAGLEVHQFFPLVKVQCSPDLQFFLCSMYAPVCTILEKAIPPCRSLCQSARNGCEVLMNKFGFRWPEALDCAKFPEAGGEALCVGEMVTGDHHVVGGGDVIANTNNRPFSPSANFGPSFNIPNTRPLPPVTNVTRDLGFSCPVQFQTPPGLDYVFRINGKEHKNCGAPCDGFLFSRDERKSIHFWTGIWAMLCVASTLFTFLTFLNDTRRFSYPERPIIFLSICYLCVGLVYVVGFFLEDSVACNEAFPPPYPGDPANIQMVETITQGNKKEGCTLLFMALYFFTMSSALWWVILTLTWFLASGMKWGHEAIESNAHYFHLVGWAVPAVKTITVLAMGKVEGDVLTGVCFVGIMNQDALKYFVFLPLLGYLIVGFLFLFAGFVSLWRIRTLIKMDGTRTDKLEKLMLRIGFFSVLYMAPMLMLLACYYYEQASLASWQLSWLSEVCQRREYGIPCPLIGTNSEIPAKPYFWVFLLKVSCTFTCTNVHHY